MELVIFIVWIKEMQDVSNAVSASVFRKTERRANRWNHLDKDFSYYWVQVKVKFSLCFN
jgi:hypothetical protein